MQTQTLDCLLVSPPEDVPRYPYLGLCFLAGVLKQELVGVEILDCAAQHFNVEQAVAYIAGRNPRIVGINVMSMMLPACYRLVAAIKRTIPGCVTVVGGAHINADPRSIKYIGADYGFHGESEFQFARFCKYVLRGEGDLSSIQGLVYYDPEKNLIVNPPDLIADLDSIPDPAYELVLHNSYYNPDADFKVVPVITSRGCPYDCLYCSKVQKTSYRYVSNDRILALLKRLVAQYGVRRVAFVDEIFTINKARVHDLCERILREKIVIAWGCATRADAIDEALLKKMRAAGCDKISFGVETGSERIRFSGNKRIPNSVYMETFKMCRRQNIKTLADYIFGHPGETLQDMFATLGFAIKLDSNYAFFHKMLPIPDSKLYEVYQQETGRLEEWKLFMRGDTDYPIYYPKTVKKAWVDLLYRIAWGVFYFSPGRFLQNLATLRNPKTLWNSLKTFLILSGSRRYRVR